MNYPRKHFLAMVASLLLWGFSFPALKIALRTNGAAAVILYRYGFSLLLVLPFFFWRYRGGFSVLRRHKYLLLLGLFNWAGSFLQFAGLRLTSAINSVILTQMMVVVVPIIAFWVLRERLNKAKAAAIVLALAGAVTLSTNLEFGRLGEGASFAGDVLTVCAVVFWALYVVCTRKWVHSVPSFWMLMGNYIGVFCLSAPVAAVTNQLAIDRTGLLLSLFLAVFCTVLPTILYNFAMHEVDATASAIMGPLESISAVILAFLMLGERLTLIGFCGSLLIVGSVYLVGGKK